MALIPIIQPVHAHADYRRTQYCNGDFRPVSKLESCLPVVVTIIVCLILPDARLSDFMLGTCCRLRSNRQTLKTAQNEPINIVTIFLGVSVGATLTPKGSDI